MTDYELCDGRSIICPYCKHEEQWTGDPIGGDGDETQTNCEDCGKEYTVRVSITVRHECYPSEDNSEELER